MVMDAVGAAASQIGQALGLVKPDKAKLVCVGDNMPPERHRDRVHVQPDRVPADPDAERDAQPDARDGRAARRSSAAPTR